MRSQFALFMLCCSAIGVKGQSYLTNADVFDYAVGDVFQSRGQAFTIWGSSPPADYTDTVTSKWISSAADTIIYTLRHWVVTYQMSPDIPPTVVSSDDTLTVTALDQPAMQFVVTDACPPVLDSMGLDPELCGRSSWWMFSAGDTCTWGYSGSSSQVVAGCGGPYFSTIDEEGSGGGYRLTYYHKAAEECGVFHELPTGLGGLDVPRTLHVFPNPTSGFVRFGEWVSDLTVQDAVGAIRRMTTAGAVVDLGAEPNGIYVITGRTRSGQYFRARVVKN